MKQQSCCQKALTKIRGMLAKSQTCSKSGGWQNNKGQLLGLSNSDLARSVMALPICNSNVSFQSMYVFTLYLIQTPRMNPATITFESFPYPCPCPSRSALAVAGLQEACSALNTSVTTPQNRRNEITHIHHNHPPPTRAPHTHQQPA